MKPITLAMEAFGPFAASQTIDFGTLGDSTFLLIHGPTGAGKTSILDAMCVALYGQTTGSERTAEQMRSQFAAPDHATSVTLEFAIGAETYRVERTPRQKRPAARNPTKTVDDPPTATLWRRTRPPGDGSVGGRLGLEGRGADGAGPAATDDATPGEVLATGTRAVTEAVEGLLGFSVEQFRQVVMLPQGRFRELLSANSSDRQEILEELFGAQLYGDFEDFLKSKKKGAKLRLDGLADRLNEVLRGCEVETTEELESLIGTAGGAREKAAEAEREARARKGVAEKALEEGGAVAALIRAAEKARAACAEAERGVTQARGALDEAAKALEQERRRDPERESTASVIERLKGLEAKVDDLAHLTDTLEEARREGDAAEKTLASAEEEAGAAAAAVEGLAERARAAQAAASTLAAERPQLESASNRLKHLKDLRGLDTDVVRAEEAERGALASQEAAQRDLRIARDAFDETERAWRTGQAAVLASTLADGAPCPVCGATDHPAPAHAEGESVSADDLERLKERTDDLRADADTALEGLSQARAAAAGLRARRAEAAEALGAADLSADSLAEMIRGQETLVTEREAGVKALAEAARLPADHAREEADAGAAAAGAAEAEGVARAALAAAKEKVSGLEGSLQTRERDVPEEYRLPGALAAALEAAERRQQILLDALRKAEGAERAADAALREAHVLLARESECAVEAEKSVEGVEEPDLPTLELRAGEARQAWETALTEAKGAADRHDALTKTLRRVEELHAEYEALETEYGVIALLSDTASGRGAAFQRWVLGVFLDEVLVAATRRLLEMSRGRYRLHQAAGPLDGRRVGGLDVEVFDEFTGLDRPASTLSGGEGFLASLALALGLAEVVQNFSGGIRLDTVFIDEGFGTLDPEALDAAIGTLLDLREHGRLVGVISHVPELRELIDCRLEVRPTQRGSTATLVVP